MKPHSYQLEAVGSVFRYFGQNQGNPLVAMPTGTGKSVVIAELLRQIFQSYPHQKIMVLTHVKELISQNHARCVQMWPQAPAGINSAGLNKRDFHHPIIFAGIGSVAKKPHQFGKVDLILIDEAHLVSDNDTTTYRKFIDALMQVNPYLKVIGFTATPWRQGVGRLTENGLFTDICFDITTVGSFHRLIAEGYMTPLVPKRMQNYLDVTGVHMQNGDFNLSQLQQAVDKDEITRAALKEAMEFGHDRKKWIVFAAGVDHSIHVADILNEMGITCKAVHSKMSDKERDAIVDEYKNGDLQAVSNNNCLTTGFDNPEIDMIVMLRPTTSVVLWCLDENTEVLTNHGFKKWNTIDLVNDLCIAIDTNTKMKTITPILGYVHRDLSENEFMINLETRHQSIRVSNKHRMISLDKNGNYTFESAEDLILKTDKKLPVSCLNTNVGLNLLDCELEFIGLYLSDGHIDKSNNEFAISQSDRYSDVQLEIERILTQCGFGWRSKSRTAEEVSKNCYKTKYGQKTYYISYGEKGLRGTRSHLKGWWQLKKYLDKQICNDLFDISPHQFEKLLYGMNLGDGSKFKSSSINWKPKTFEIAMGNDEIYCDRFQALAVTNGYRADKSKTHDTCFVLYISPDKFKFIDNYANDRRWKIEEHSSEKIWCIENENGTLITRRNGKVTIMGNCQMIGRGTRPVYYPGYDLSSLDGRLAAIHYGGKKNCIAEGQLVLTNIGLVPIENIDKSMKLWDGFEFVEHDGLIYKGEKDVITYAGLTATRDHLVHTKEGWKTFGNCANQQIAITVTGNGRNAIQQSDSYFRGYTQKKWTALFIDKMQFLRSGKDSMLFNCNKRSSRLQALRDFKSGFVGYTKMADKSVYFRSAKVLQHIRFSLSRLWGSWNTVCILRTNGDGSLYTKRIRFTKRSSDKQNRQQWSLRTWKLGILYSNYKYEQSERWPCNSEDTFIPNKSSGNTIRGRNFNWFFSKWVDRCGNNRKVPQKVLQTKRRVWDIQNAGPRNCFTCEGLLVHNCLVLDFAGNTQQLGPINDPRLPRKKGEKGGTAPVKACPGCNTYIHISATVCEHCGQEFTFQTKITASSGNQELLSGELPIIEEMKVDRITYSLHHGRGKPDMVKVTYYCNLQSFSEYICPQHNEGSYPLKKAREWWRKRNNLLVMPQDAEVFLSHVAKLKPATHIRVWINKKYPEIMSHCFDGSFFNKQEADPFEIPEVVLNQPQTQAVDYESNSADDDYEDDIPF